VTPWVVQLLTLIGVAVGAIGSFVSTRLIENAKWKRDETAHWNSKRLECYTEFAIAIKRQITLTQRIIVTLGLPSTGQPLDPAIGLPMLVEAEQDLSIKWEQVLVIGSQTPLRPPQIGGTPHGTHIQPTCPALGLTSPSILAPSAGSHWGSGSLVSATGVSGVGQMTSRVQDSPRLSLTGAAPDPATQGLAFTMVSKKVNDCDKWMDDKHADYPPSFCFIGNLFINGHINNHPYFKSEN
jgi:hypothetical protein